MNKAAGSRPEEKGRSFAEDAPALPVLALFALLALWCWSAWGSPAYSPDSWAYYELSRSIWRGGYRLLGLRGYAYPPAAPSGAFPPLWPAIWSLTGGATGLGARAGLLASFACAAVVAGFSEAIGRQLCGRRWVGLAAAAGLFAMPGFAEEVEAARSIPLQMALACGLVWTLLRPGRIGPARASAMGVLCGALVLARFDMLAFAILFGLAVLLLSRSLASAAAFGLLFLAAALPWVAVSWLWFKELFHSDSSFVASAVDRATFVTDWYPPGRHLLTLHEAPGAWAAKLAGNVPPFLAGAAASPGAAGLAMLAAALAALVVGRREAAGPTSRRGSGDESARRFAAVLPAVAAPLLLCIATGYFDGRYFSLAYWYLLMTLLTSAVAAWSRGRHESRVARATMLLALGTLAIAALANVPRGFARPLEPDFPKLQALSGIKGCLARLGARPTDRILFENDTWASRWAAVRRLPAATLPRNFRRPGIGFSDKQQFLARYDIRFAVGAPEVLEPIFGPLIRPPAMPCGASVYRLDAGEGGNR